MTQHFIVAAHMVIIGVPMLAFLILFAVVVYILVPVVLALITMSSAEQVIPFAFSIQKKRVQESLPEPSSTI